MSTTPPGQPAPLTPAEKRELAMRAKRFLALCLVLALVFLALAALGVVFLF